MTRLLRIKLRKKYRAQNDFKTLLQQPDRDVANQRSGQRLLASTASSVSHHVAQDNMVEQTRCAPLLFAPDLVPVFAFRQIPFLQ